MEKKVQKCSGYGCIQRDKCLHFTASKGKPTKGRWIDADRCITADTPYEKLKVEDAKQKT